MADQTRTQLHSDNSLARLMWDDEAADGHPDGERQRAAEQDRLARTIALTTNDSPPSADETEACRRFFEVVAQEIVAAEQPAADSQAVLARMNSMSETDAPPTDDDRERLARMNALSDLKPDARPHTHTPPPDDEASFGPPQDGIEATRAIYQSQIDMINAFRPKFRKRGRDYGYER